MANNQNPKPKNIAPETFKRIVENIIPRVMRKQRRQEEAQRTPFIYCLMGCSSPDVHRTVCGGGEE